MNGAERYDRTEEGGSSFEDTIASVLLKYLVSFIGEKLTPRLETIDADMSTVKEEKKE